MMKENAIILNNGDLQDSNDSAIAFKAKVLKDKKQYNKILVSNRR